MAGRIQRFVERLPLLVDRPALAMVAALVGALGGVGLRLLAGNWMPPGYPFLTFFPMVLLVTLLLGWIPGLLCGIASGLIAWYAFITPGTVYMFNSGVAVALAFFSFVAATQILLIHWLQTLVAQAGRERENSRVLAENRALLFRELQHRVSNNLQVVAALLSAQKRGVADPGAAAALDEASHRLALIGRISRQLHDPDGARIGTEPFLRSLCDDVMAANGHDGLSLSIAVDEGIEITPDAAIPFALILTESIANAVEHGFPDQRPGHIRITFRRAEPGRLTLEVRDDGVGPPPDFAPDRTDSVGLGIVHLLARQLRGSFALSRDHETVARLDMAG
jgi:two-component sensor histidine kinase